MTDWPQAMPAIVSDEDWPSSILDMLPGFAGRLNVYRMMAHNPELLAAWANLRNHVVLNSRLTPQQSETVILRAGWRLGSRYEWMHHVSRARKLGMEEAAIAACTAAPACSPESDLLIRAVDALLDHARIPQDLLGRLTDAIGLPAVLDVMATVGMYSTLAFIVETFAVPVDEDIVSELGSVGWPRR